MLQLSFKRFFLYALLIKGILFLLFAYFFNKDAPKNNNVNYIFAFSKDYHSYIDPAINLFEKGEYFEEDNGHVQVIISLHEDPNVIEAPETKKDCRLNSVEKTPRGMKS
jgi:hypothetical protein